jgi:hypothetical protein
MYQWYISTYVVLYVKVVANSSTTKAQSTGLVRQIIFIHVGCNCRLYSYR